MSAPSSTASSRSASPDLQVDTMQIFIKNLSGDMIPITVPSSTSISNLTTLLSLRTSVPEASLRLVHAGRHLTPSSTLLSNNIPKDSTIHVAGSLRGGMPPKRPKCSFNKCKKWSAGIVGVCGFCEQAFCDTHRILEDHHCVKLADCKRECHERNAEQLNSERTQVIKGI